MAVKYKEYKPDEHTWSDEVNNAQKNAEYWNGQQLKDFTFDDFAWSDATNNAQAEYDSHKSNAPGDFSFSKQQGFDDIWNQLQNRKPFTYDVNGDALYQQYKDQYIQGGKMAMMDTMGQAAAMTGGYGNSYAQSVGQQAYQGYLTQLTDKIPELYQLAMSKYQMEGDELRSQYGLYSDQYDKEYGQHRDSVGDYQFNLNHLANRLDASRATDKDIYGIAFDKALAENESYNSNIVNERANANDIYNNLKQTEWGRYMDNETLKKIAIEVANDNLNRNEQSRIADAELKLARDKYDLEKSQLDFKALEEKYEGYISPEEQAKMQKAENSEATKTLKASVLTKTELARRGYQTTIGGKTKRFDNYTQYIDAVLENNYKSGKLTEHEVAYLKGYYGIE